MALIVAFFTQAYFVQFSEITLSFSGSFFDNSDIALYNIDSIDKKDIIRNILIIILSILLFVIGYKLNKKNKSNNPNAKLKNNEPYLLTLKISSALMQIDDIYRTSELNEFINSVKFLQEKLSVESNFGYGKTDIIDCENEIASQLQCLINEVPNITSGNMSENINKLNKVVININSLLQIRCELKKK